MSEKSSIEWTDSTWNPVTGCTKISPGCSNCYAESYTQFRIAPGSPDWIPANAGLVVQEHPDRLNIPFGWKKHRRIFTCSMGDLFHTNVSVAFIARVVGTIAATPRHTYQVLTKRPARMSELFRAPWFVDHVRVEYQALRALLGNQDTLPDFRWPLPNLIAMTSAENQRWADERIDWLVRTPAVRRGVSIEPLLSPITLRRWLTENGWDGRGERKPSGFSWRSAIDWVIVGGESGRGAGHKRDRWLVIKCWSCGKRKEDRAVCGECHGTGYRPMMHPQDWVRNIRNECVAAGVPFFFKQWGGPTTKSAGRILDWKLWSQQPGDTGTDGVTDVIPPWAAIYRAPELIDVDEVAGFARLSL